MFNKFLRLQWLFLSWMICVGTASAQTGSLWGGKTANYQSVFADSVAGQVGDLITINVSMSTASKQKKESSTKKENDLQDAIDHLFFNTPDGPAGATGTTPPKDGTFNFWRYRNLPPSFQFGGDRSHKGGGSLNNEETLTTTLQARVVDILPNNTLRIQAKRKFSSGNEKTDVVLSGLVRRDDIDSDNSISSTKISDLQLTMEGTGDLSRDQRKGFLTRLYETLNPF